jgi:hypothetical protein
MQTIRKRNIKLTVVIVLYFSVLYEARDDFDNIQQTTSV